MARPGTPHSCTPERIDAICEAVALGVTLECAAACGDVDASTLFRWRKQGAKDIEAGEDTAFAELARRFQKAMTEWERAALSSVRNAAEDGQWQAGAWLLERRKPADFGRRLQTENTTTVAVSTTRDTIASLIAAAGGVAMDEEADGEDA